MSPSLPTFYHPLELLAAEVLVTTLVIGFTSSRSLLRLAALPIPGLCAYGVVTTSRWYMRSHWATIFSGFAGAFALQYLELALLSQWSFEDDLKNKCVSGQSNSLIANGKAVVSDDKRAKGNVVGTTKGEKQGDLLERFKFGYYSTFSFRSVNTPSEVRNTPAFPNNEVPDKHNFLTSQYLILLACILTVDISAFLFTPSNPSVLFAQDKIPVFSRLEALKRDEIVLRVVSTAVYWVNMHAIAQVVTSLAAVVAIECKLGEIKEWRPLYGPVSSAYSLRGFWGNFWPQTLRQILTHPATCIAQDIFGMHKHNLVAHLIKLLIPFATSGVLYMFADLGGGLPLEQSGSLRFFLTQVIGIVIEDTVKGMVSSSTSVKSEKRFTFLAKILGYMWVASFLVWSTPMWLYPVAGQGLQAPFLPWSLVTWMVKYIKT
ncbi:hypothetical protein P154DRAFT_622999 [Amniculicola lignicola CBS 123094]|uniref:Wax synthase domain-containing protein n=1 Tax=Amniculicola lignicola CBS 123094 TaxID=1392246 RepID=A0A6A5W4L2_9PLEO|nr:hypothetical protein P154DRAFT_622999 [Amniculicola lignicola CBS 123094]